MWIRCWGVAAALTLIAVCAYAASGADHGAPDTKACPSIKSQKIPSIPEINLLVQCESEGVTSGDLFLLREVSVEVGGTRPAGPADSGARWDVDFSRPMHSIRGSYTRYQCRYLSPSNTGKNCRSAKYTRMNGDCWRTTFGDWRCLLANTSAPTDIREGIAPPAQ